MLRHPLLLVALIALVVSPALAQMPTPPSDTSDPRILVLLPQQVTIDKKLKKEAEAFLVTARQGLVASTAEQLSMIDSLRAEPEKFERLGISLAETEEVIRSQPDFAKADFGTMVTVMTTSMLWNKIAIHAYNNAKVRGVFEPTKLDSATLAQLAARRDAHFILALPSISIQVDKKKQRVAMFHAQLYDRTGQRLFDTTITSGKDDGESYACRQERFDCPMTNCVTNLIPPIIYQIVQNLPKSIYEKRLTALRNEVLLRDYYGKPVSLRIKNLLPIDSTMPPLSTVFACFANPDTTAIVALYFGPKSLRTFENVNGFGITNIAIDAPNGDFRDLDDETNTCGFMLTGAKVDGRWYFKRQGITYLNADSVEAGRKKFMLTLQKFNFFRPMSTEPNPDFWSSGLFERVPDPSSFLSKTDMGRLDATKLELFRKYVGQYIFVFEQIATEDLQKARE